MRKKTVIGCLLAGVVVVLVLAVASFVLLDRIGESLPSGDRIAHIDLEGIITSQMGGSLFGEAGSMTERLTRDLKNAAEDEGVKAIVLRINSPGGEITASDTIYDAVKTARESKPIVVYMDSMAASGGYYVACAANEIVANETTLTGSIGVIIQTLSYYELFEKVGLAALVFKSGELKDTLSGARKMNPEEQSYVQSMVDQMFDKFLEVVSEGRGIPKAELRDGIADGRVLSGIDALKEKLVDSNGYLEDAYERARTLANAPDAEVDRYRRETGFLELLGMMSHAGSGERGTVQIDLSDRLLPRLTPGMIYLLPSYYIP